MSRRPGRLTRRRRGSHSGPANPGKDVEKAATARRPEGPRSSHRASRPLAPLLTGAPRFPYGRHIFDEREIAAATEALRDRRLSGGERTLRFEEAFAGLVGAPFSCFANSGSSANLLAVAALCANERGPRLRAGDEVVVPALSFPTTVNAFLHHGLTVVLADVGRDTFTVDTDRIEACRTSRTRALSLLHAFGNPCDLDPLLSLARARGLLVLEDACEALGTTYEGRAVGTFGTLGTYSFHPAHQITTGEGGGVVGSDPSLLPILHSLRDWGRVCPCPRCSASGHGARARSRARLPADWDPHYLYALRGFNLKPLELQAAVGLVQLEKFPSFRAARRANFARLRAWFAEREDLFLLPRTPRGGDPCWFAYPVVLREGRLERAPLLRFLAARGVETRPFLAGNPLRQPAYRGARIRAPGPLPGADYLVRNGFFLGLHPALEEGDLAEVLAAFEAFLAGRRSEASHPESASRRRATRRSATRSKE
jgi:CDP-4-dehydro-6-deoxyglucose reductase, E1